MCNFNVSSASCGLCKNKAQQHSRRLALAFANDLFVVPRKRTLGCDVCLLGDHATNQIAISLSILPRYTIIPIAFAFVVMAIHWLIVLQELPKVGNKFWVGITLGQVALFFFYRGLDDDNDWCVEIRGL